MNYTFNHPEDECSEMFLDSFNGGGSAYQICRCGIEHYAVDSDYMEEEERNTVPLESDKIKWHYDVDAVTYFELDNKFFVKECASCRQQLKKYEDFIWYERSGIRHYFKTRVEQEKKWADYEHLQNVLSGIAD